MTLTTRTLALAVAFLGVLSVVAGPALAQSDSQVGIWKLNVAKSKYRPDLHPRAGPRRSRPPGRGAKVVVDQTPADGSSGHWEFTASYDGKDIPVTGNNPNADTVSRTRVNANTVKTVIEKNGKVPTTQTSTCRRWEDANRHDQGRNASGQKVNNVAVYEKQ